MATAFADPLRRRVVFLLATREHSLGELASITGFDLKRLHYHVLALKKLGLVAVAGKRSRAGRPIKLYRAVASAFFVPVEAMAEPPESAMAAELRAAQAKHTDPSREGVLYHLGSEGKFLIQPVSNAGTKRVPTADLWRVLRLSQAEASRLADDVDACLKAAAGRSRGATNTYLIHLAFAPRPKV